jgi:hypothetical protein
MRPDPDPGTAPFRLRPVALLAIGSIPAVWTLLSVRFLIERPLSAFVACKWNDTVEYWHQIKSFSEVGFACGYYGYNELRTPIDAFHFDVHGPVFPMVYGSLAAVFGWTPWSAFFYNWAVFAAGVVTFGMLAALTPRQVALLAGIVGCCWTIPLWLLAPTEEPLHMAAAFVFAAAFARLLFGSRPLTRGALVALWAFLTAMSLMRLSWAVLALPLLLLSPGWRSRKAVLGAVVAGVLYILGAIFVFHLIAAPGGNSLVELLDGLLVSPGKAVQAVAVQVAPNVEAALVGTRYGVVQTWLCMALLLVLLGIGIKAWRRSTPSRGAEMEARRALNQSLFHCFQLGTILVGCWLLYYPNGYERVLLPHLLLSLALLVVAGRNGLIAAVIVVMAAAAPLARRDFVDDQSLDLHVDTAALRAATESFERVVSYQRDAPSPWCNTVLIDLPQYDWHVIAIPAGLGVEWTSVIDPPVHPLFSKYVWMIPQAIERVRATYGSPELTLLLRFDDGMELYRNERSACGEEGRARAPARARDPQRANSRP